MEWSRIIIIVVGIGGIVLSLIKWYISGEDLPSNILTILSLIISGALGPNMLNSITGLKKEKDKANKKKEDEE